MFASDRKMRELIFADFFDVVIPDFTVKEKQIHFIGWTLILAILVLIFSYIFPALSLVMFSIFSILIPFYLVLFNWKWFDEKFGVGENPVRKSIVLQMPFFIFLFPMGLVSGLLIGNLLGGFGVGCAILYPALGILLRTKSIDKSGILNYDSKELIWRMPKLYWAMSFLPFGIFLTSHGFALIGNAMTYQTTSSNLLIGIIIIFVGLMLQTLYIFPDMLNRILPFNLQTNNGYYLLVSLTIILWTISTYIVYFLVA